MCAERIFSRHELGRYDGEQTAQMYVCYNGIVYDVTDCPKWRSGLHEGLHFPGQELTQELRENAPHSEEVFDLPCVKRVGRLETV
jgi:predicted heme/steroid binding protein